MTHPLQDLIEKTVTNGKGYDRRINHKYFENSSKASLQLTLLNIAWIDGNVSPEDLSTLEGHPFRNQEMVYDGGHQAIIAAEVFDAIDMFSDLSDMNEVIRHLTTPSREGSYWSFSDSLGSGRPWPRVKPEFLPLKNPYWNQ